MEFIKWLVTSSADPQRYSLAVKGALSLGVAWLIKLAGITCGIALICLSFDADVLMSAVDTIANIVYLALTLVGAAWTLWGLLRKAWLNRWSAYGIVPKNLPFASEEVQG